MDRLPTTVVVGICGARLGVVVREAQGRGDAVTDQAKRLVCDLTLPGCWIGGSFDRTRRPKITDFRIELFSICPLESGVSKIGHLRPPN